MPDFTIEPNEKIFLDQHISSIDPVLKWYLRSLLNSKKNNQSNSKIF